MAFQLFKNGQPVSKAHSTWEPCVIEAVERGLVLRTSYSTFIVDGAEIKKVEAASTAAK